MKVSALTKFYPIIALTVVVFIADTLLAATDSFTIEKIEYQKEQHVLSMLHEIFPDMARYTFEDDVYTIYDDGAKIGYGFLAVGKGYGGDIDILVGLENETMVKGISIISHTETPGLGDKITEPAFTNRFAGINIADVALTKEGGKVDAISGSTISSKAVIDAVRTTAMEKVKVLKEQG